jgi:hypothetical protein
MIEGVIGFGREFVRAGVIIALVASALVIFSTGDRNGDDVTADLSN